jgi:hypothetical protein
LLDSYSEQKEGAEGRTTNKKYLVFLIKMEACAGESAYDIVLIASLIIIIVIFLVLAENTFS